MTVKNPLRQEDLAHFIGTETWWRHPLFRNYLYTDGVRHVAEHGGAYWLLLDIFAFQADNQIRQHPKLKEIQFWTLTVNSDQSATLVCEWDKGQTVFSHEYHFTDFPIAEIKFYLQNNVLMLPSEY